MSLNFPASPTVGQQSTQNGRTYEWSGYVWRIVGTIAGHAATHAANGSDALTLVSSQISDFTAAVVSAAPPTTNASLLNAGTLADARLSGNVVLTSNAALNNSRTPTAHASSHASGGSDALTLAANQVTSGTVATARLATGTANSSTYLRGDQTWATLTAITDTIFHPFFLGGM